MENTDDLSKYENLEKPLCAWALDNGFARNLAGYLINRNIGISMYNNTIHILLVQTGKSSNVMHRFDEKTIVTLPGQIKLLKACVDVYNSQYSKPEFKAHWILREYGSDYDGWEVRPTDNIHNRIIDLIGKYELMPPKTITLGEDFIVINNAHEVYKAIWKGTEE